MPQLPVSSTTVGARALSLGTFVFKGSDQPLQMVSLVTPALAGRHALLPADEPRGKGRRVAAPRDKGKPRGAILPLPDLLTSLRGTFVEAASAWRDRSSSDGAQDNQAVARDYASWLTVELTRRHVIWSHQ